MKTPSLFERERLTLERSIELSAESLAHYGAFYDRWALAFSGGKDSSATVTLVAHLIDSGRVPAPKSLTVLYADTRQELPPLHAAAMETLAALRERGIDTRVVLPELDHRFFVYMLGRGVPPPSNTFRWCTPKLKVTSMERELEQLRRQHGQKLLMLTGVRLGESAARDQRIAMSCSKDGGECGQGWYQQSSANAIADTLAPILHWRICNVWDWLIQASELGYPTDEVALTYGMSPESETEEPISLRTGCVGCPLVGEDRALETILAEPQWAYLVPLRELRPLYQEVKKPQYRLRKPTETNQDGSLAAKQGRLGPLTMEARRWLLERVLAIQQQVKDRAGQQGRPQIELINEEELARIEELIAADTWPEKWQGNEPRGDEPYARVMADGSVQPLLSPELFN